MSRQTVIYRLSQLLQVPSADELYQDALDFFADLGFSPTNWLTGSLTRGASAFLGLGLAAGARNVALIVQAGLLDLAKGTWLDLLAESHFDETRDLATYATHTVTISSSADMTTPWVIEPGALRVRDSTTGKTFHSTNEEQITLAAGAGNSEPIPFKADSPGSDYNSATNAIDELVTTKPGASITASVQVTSARDDETDPALRQKCRDKWAANVAIHPPSAAYRYWAITASDEVTRAFVDDTNPDGPGTLRVYLAGDSGTVLAGAVTEADAALQAKKSSTARVQTLNSTELTCALTGTVYYDSSEPLSDFQAAFEGAVDDWFKQEPIGGTDLDGTKKIYEGLLSAYLTGDDDDGNARLPSLRLPKFTSGDFAISTGQAAVADYSALSYVAI